MKVEEITPYDNTRAKTGQVREMFDNIAPAYDFMNRAMTLGVDKWWRHVAVNYVKRNDCHNILDLATGTGDLAIAMARALPDAHITGADLSRKMLDIARKKVKDVNLQGHVDLIEANGTALPFADNTFDCVTIAYGIRNFEDIEKGYREMFRVTKDNGIIIVLELSTPQNPIALGAYRLYTGYLIPLAGRMVSHDPRAYSYLPQSIAAVPQRHNMTALLHKAGYSDVTFRSMTFGACCIYTGRKPFKQ